MPTPSIKEWVEYDPGQQPFRAAVHTILTGISGSPDLQTSMVMKGGILLALRYHSSRYTRDIDFSTGLRLQDFDLGRFVESFDSQLVWAVDKLNYGLDCRVQSCKQMPARKDASFPTIRLTIGYANKSDSRAQRRLAKKQAIHTVQIDYSLNEPAGATELFEVGEGASIQTYSYIDLMAEKFRALLQQEVRKRFRRQDVYDLAFIIDYPSSPALLDRKLVLERFMQKAKARGLMVTSESMSNPEIIRRSKKEYVQLQAEIEGDLPPFEDIYQKVEDFYRSLPWPAL